MKVKFTNILAILLVFFATLFILPMTTSTAEAKPPIPDGCPQSVAPATPPPASCADIPMGCPGSTLLGPPSAGFDPSTCPFEVPSSGGGTGGGGDTVGSANTTGRFECTGDACVNDNPITEFLFVVINILSGLIGIIVVIVIIMAGIQYTTSGGNPQQAAQAKKRIINAITALVAFFFLFAILQWLIPGGIFKS